MPPSPESTLIIIKPDFMDSRINMLQLFMDNSFRVTHNKTVIFSPEQAAEFYKDLEKKDPCFPIKVMALSKGPAEAVILNKVNAIRNMLTLMTSPACCNLLNSGLEYKLHASMSAEKAANEIRYVFPNVVLEPSRNIRFGAMCGRHKLTGLISEGIFAAQQEKTDDINMFLYKWLHDHSYVSEESWCE